MKYFYYSIYLFYNKVLRHRPEDLPNKYIIAFMAINVLAAVVVLLSKLSICVYEWNSTSFSLALVIVAIELSQGLFRYYNSYGDRIIHEVAQ